MATRKRGGGHGSMSRKKYQNSMRRLKASIQAASSVSESAMDRMDTGNSVRRSTRRCVASTSMKSLRKKAMEHQQKTAKKLAESYMKIIRNVKAAEAAAKKASAAAVMDDLVARTSHMKLNNGCGIMGGSRRNRN
jgi:hypothetical protein